MFVDIIAISPDELRVFMQALLHHGPHLEVLEPESVRNKMKEMILEMAEKYK